MITFYAAFAPAAASVATMLVIAVAAWTTSVVRRNAGIADLFWGMFIATGSSAYAMTLPESGTRAVWLMVLVWMWALRLSGYIAWRNHGQPEDRRYQEIRARNQPNFEWKSLYLVFGLQALLAMAIATPLMAAVSSEQPSGWLDVAGILVWLGGWAYESVADFQLARFKALQRADPSLKGRVLDSGLWRYSRHPNYFGECCVWWGFYLIALSAGHGWTIFAPLLMTFLLLKVSGVTLLDKSMSARHPAYLAYIARTSAFFPWLPKNK